MLSFKNINVRIKKTPFLELGDFPFLFFFYALTLKNKQKRKYEKCFEFALPIKGQWQVIISY